MMSNEDWALALGAFILMMLLLVGLGLGWG